MATDAVVVVVSLQRRLFDKIKRGVYHFHEEIWGPVSKEAKVRERTGANHLTRNPRFRFRQGGRGRLSRPLTGVGAFVTVHLGGSVHGGRGRGSSAGRGPYGVAV
jgi:hypothetical protein